MSAEKNEDGKECREEEKLSDEDLIKRIQDYFFNDDLASKFESFVDSNCKVIDLHSEEYRLEYTEKHNEYKSLFEHELTSYINALGYSVQDFYKSLSSKMSEDSNSSEAIFGMILQSVTEFDVFMVMMREAAVSADTVRK